MNREAPEDKASEDAAPDYEASRLRLLRGMRNIKRAWKTCARPSCKRKRACVDRTLSCVEPPEKLTPYQHSRLNFELRRRLEQRIAELSAQGKAE